MKMKNLKILLVSFIIAIALMLSNNVFAEDKTLQQQIDEADSGAIITLNKEYNENITIASGKTLTLDLNSQTLNSDIKVYGTLTIKDSGKGGKINSSQIDVGVFDENNHDNDKVGELIFESGILSTQKYGIYAVNGNVTVNGGTITSKYAPLAGNNTTGVMKFKITGGTLTASKGPAVYMPGPISLDITGGTLNGGVSLRMGKVSISGGTINSITSEIDKPEEYYDYCGNAFFPDALFVLGRTYPSSNKEYTNELDLNITGGTFNCENNYGSAVAIYDMGKVEQSMKVNISGSAVLSTKSTTRSSYQVLSLEEIGVTNPKTDYGNSAYTGNISTTITGGTYTPVVEEKYVSDGYKTVGNTVYEKGSVIVTEVEHGTVTVEGSKLEGLVYGDEVKFTAKAKDGYELTEIEAHDGKNEKVAVTFNEKNNNYTFTMPANTNVVITAIFNEIKQEETTEVVEVPEIDTTKPVEEVTIGVTNKEATEKTLLVALEEIKDSDPELAKKIEGKEVTVAVEVNNDINVDDETKTTIESTIKGIKADIKVANYFDIAVVVKADGKNVGNIENLSSSIELTVALPENLQGAEEGYTRTYYIVRQHEGKTEILNTTLSEDGTYLTFESDKFSTYALAYEDTKVEDTTLSNPQTGDNIIVYAITLLVSVIGICSVVIIKKNNKKC
jgi:hypothetical protein